MRGSPAAAHVLREGGAAMPEAAARWPYGVGLTTAIVAVLGLLYAPISGIVYFLALPGILLSAVWAWLHRSPARAPLATSAGLIVLGFLAGIVVLVISRLSPAPPELGYHEWVAASAFTILVALPGLSLLAAIPFEIIGLRRPGTARRSERGMVSSG